MFTCRPKVRPASGTSLLNRGRADGLDRADPPLSDEALARVWRPELDRRRAEIERGEVQTVDARTAIDGMRARLRSGAR